MKIFPPKKIVFYTSLLIAVISFGIILLSLLLNNVQHAVIISLISATTLFIAVLISVGVALDKFFYSNIRLIYRNIIQLRSHGLKKVERQIRDEKVLGEINRLLIEWEKDNQEEIGHLKELEEYRREFLGNVSHELKTPIFTVQGYVHTLLDGGIEDQDINLLYLKKAGKSIDRLISIVDDLESISKLEAGEMILENRTFDFTELAQEVIESLELRAAERNITLEVDEESLYPHYVFADKDRIRQVLDNLLVNSIKYGKQGGKTKISIEEGNDTITVDINDDGIGISKQHLGRLFERFYRVDKSRSREQGGTGLGLAIVKHILEAHKQNITVESEPGKGTLFTFTLRKSK